MENKKTVTPRRLAVWAIIAAAPSLTARATDLSYTYLDFQSLNNTIEKTAEQSPFPGQTVRIQTSGGNGIGAVGSYAFGEHFYFGGLLQELGHRLFGRGHEPDRHRPSDGHLRPRDGESRARLRAQIRRRARLHGGCRLRVVQLRFRIDRRRELRPQGLGRRRARRTPLEPEEAVRAVRDRPLLDGGEGRPHGAPLRVRNLGRRRAFAGTSSRASGVGIEHESGDIGVTTISMRFSFGNLPL